MSTKTGKWTILIQLSLYDDAFQGNYETQWLRSKIVPWRGISLIESMPVCLGILRTAYLSLQELQLTLRWVVPPAPQFIISFWGFHRDGNLLGGVA